MDRRCQIDTFERKKNEKFRYLYFEEKKFDKIKKIHLCEYFLGLFKRVFIKNTDNN